LSQLIYSYLPDTGLSLAQRNLDL